MGGWTLPGTARRAGGTDLDPPAEADRTSKGQRWPSGLPCVHTSTPCPTSGRSSSNEAETSDASVPACPRAAVPACRNRCPSRWNPLCLQRTPASPSLRQKLSEIEGFLPPQQLTQGPTKQDPATGHRETRPGYRLPGDDGRCGMRPASRTRARTVHPPGRGWRAASRTERRTVAPRPPVETLLSGSSNG
jgi:hypothetical protein